MLNKNKNSLDLNEDVDLNENKSSTDLNNNIDFYFLFISDSIYFPLLNKRFLIWI